MNQNKCNWTVTIILIYLFISTVYSQETFYDRRYDYYDIDTLLHNIRLLKKYLDCFVGKGPCTPIGRVFRQILPDAVQTACQKCSPSQRRLAQKTFNAFKRNFPETHAELVAKLDPENKYYKTFEKVIANA